jgi:hypothetical protein
MAEILIKIDFKRYANHLQLVQDLSPVFAATTKDDVVFEINFNASTGLIYSDFLTLIYASVDYLRRNKIKVRGRNFFDPIDTRIDYVSRVNFFELIGMEYDEKFKRRNSTGRFTEITRFDSSDYLGLQNSIFEILNSDETIALNVKAVFEFCLNEILDNVLNHSALPKKFGGYGICSVQLFPKLSEVRLIICDSGIGVREALSIHPDGIYTDISNEEAVRQCTIKGVTNKIGAGFGLFATSEFINKNQGQFLIYSGNHYTFNYQNELLTREGSYWQGTIVFMKIKTNNIVDYKEFMKGYEHLNLEEDYNEKYNITENLW